MAKNTPGLVIIGSGSGGLPVASELKKHGANYEIKVFTRDTDIAYSPCGIPFVLGGDIPSFDDLLMEKKVHYTEMGIEIRDGVEVTRIDTDNNRIFVGSEEVEYDFLVIATGTFHSALAIEDGGLGGVFSAHTKTLRAAKELDAYLRTQGAGNAVILGSGSIDLEMAVACLKRGMKVTVVEKRAQLLQDWLDVEMADVVRAHLEGLGIRVITGKKARRIKGDVNGKAASVEFGEESIEAQVVFQGTTFKPYVRLALEDGIEVSEHGIVIDEACRVKKAGHILPNVFASGACTQAIDIVTGRADFFFRASSSIKKAWVIADRLMGRMSILKPQVNPMVTVLGGLHIGCVGINSQKAAAHGIRVIAGSALGISNSRYYTGGRTIHMRLIFEDGSNRLIGGQVISRERGVKERIDALGMAICCGLTTEELSGLETSYSPPVAHLTDVMTEAARDVKRDNEA
ncbi:MAG: FAD-dependent oxidoreductase [Candidatus Methanoperedens sp.]|nr:FAD-dependent oxidoreductase [Candidatus Methanoperedens sp.]MCZ7394945.1 FAD-dependent oxidoreductase [Candidatus Methanoperedens sp.]